MTVGARHHVFIEAFVIAATGALLQRVALLGLLQLDLVLLLLLLQVSSYFRILMGILEFLQEIDVNLCRHWSFVVLPLHLSLGSGELLQSAVGQKKETLSFVEDFVDGDHSRVPELLL